MPFWVSIVDLRTILLNCIASIPILIQEMENLVSNLVDDDPFGSSVEVIENGIEEPADSLRVSTGMQISRPSTAQMVLGADSLPLPADSLLLPADHPLLQLVHNASLVWGRVLAGSDGPSLVRLELTIFLGDDDANALMLQLLGGR